MRHATTTLARSLAGTLAACLIAASAAWAEVGASFTIIDNTSQLTGYVTQDLNTLTDTDWVGAAMVVELDAGSFYQDGFGSSVAPNLNFFSLFPSLEFDTYMTGGTLGIGVHGAGGGAGGSAYQFDTQRLDASWTPNADGLYGQAVIARISLTDDSQGRWSLALFQENDDYRYDLTGPIVNGVMQLDP